MDRTFAALGALSALVASRRRVRGACPACALASPTSWPRFETGATRSARHSHPRCMGVQARSPLPLNTAAAGEGVYIAGSATISVSNAANWSGSERARRACAPNAPAATAHSADSAPSAANVRFHQSSPRPVTSMRRYRSIRARAPTKAEANQLVAPPQWTREDRSPRPESENPGMSQATSRDGNAVQRPG